MADYTITKKSSVLKMVYTSLMTALVFITTFSLIIPVPFTSGYIHPGDVMVFLSGLLLGPLYGAFAAGVGSALSDLLAGFTFWALPTLLIKGLMAASVGFIAHKLKAKHFKWFIGVTAVIWSLFTVITYQMASGLTESNPLFNSTITTLITEGSTDMDSAALTLLLEDTSTYLLTILIGLPVIVIILFIVTKVLKQSSISFQTLFSFVIAGIIMIVGYYITYGVLVGNFIVPIFSIPANILQFAFGFVGAFLLAPIIPMLRRSIT